MLSIWEKQQFIHYDHIIVGGGIVGLTTAFYIQQKYPSHRVVVLERGLFPSGASTKNAGFACMGSPTELLGDLAVMSADKVLSLFLLRKKGLERLRQLLGDEAMGYAANGSYELIDKNQPLTAEDLEKLNELLWHELGMTAFRDASNKIQSFGFEPTMIGCMIENCCEGEINTGMMMRHLLHKVQQIGVDIKTGCEVTQFNEHPHHVELMCRQPFSKESISFFAATVSICTNAFTTSLFPDLDIQPGRGQVLLTQPIPNLKFKGIFHMDQGYYYFREYKGCVLFGGGRNLDFAAEQTTSFELNNAIQADLEQKLHNIILPRQSVDIEHRWTGIMAFGATKQPILSQYSTRISLGVRMGGMGVAMGSEIGFQLSTWV